MVDRIEKLVSQLIVAVGELQEEMEELRGEILAGRGDLVQPALVGGGTTDVKIDGTD